MLEKFHRKYIGDRNFYKRYIALALPMIIQNAVTNLVSFLDNIMVGQLGTEQMSGVADHCRGIRVRTPRLRLTVRRRPQ